MVPTRFASGRSASVRFAPRRSAGGLPRRGSPREVCAGRVAVINPNEFADRKAKLADLPDKRFDLILRHVRAACQYPQIIPRRAGNDSELVILLIEFENVVCAGERPREGD